MAELSLIKSYFNLFLTTVQNKHPRRFSYTTAYIWIKAMLLAEQSKLESNEQKKENKKQLKELQTIYDETTDRIKRNLPSVEMVLNKNLEERGLQRKVNLDGKEFTTFQLHHGVEQALLGMVKIATELAVKYSLDMPLDIGSGMGQSGQMDFNALGQNQK